MAFLSRVTESIVEGTECLVNRFLYVIRAFFGRYSVLRLCLWGHLWFKFAVLLFP